MQFTLDTTFFEVTDGHIKLEWRSAMETSYELQQSDTDDFADPKIVYRGPDRASFISGLRDGTYYYRVRAHDSGWSDIITINVRHQSLKLAFALFGIGGVVFLLTVFVVVHGARSVSPNDL